MENGDLIFRGAMLAPFYLIVIVLILFIYNKIKNKLNKK
jgi:hypothetical protein